MDNNYFVSDYQLQLGSRRPSATITDIGPLLDLVRGPNSAPTSPLFTPRVSSLLLFPSGR